MDISMARTIIYWVSKMLDLILILHKSLPDRFLHTVSISVICYLTHYSTLELL